MKRFLFGCFLLFLAGLGVGGYFFYTRVLRPVTHSLADLTQLTRLGRVNDRLANKDPYTPPADGVLSAEQVRRFLAVQAEVRDSTGATFGRVRERLGGLPEKMKNPDGTLSFDFGAMMGAFKGIGPDILALKERQVTALNRQDFSRAEYRWVRESVFRAMGNTYVGQYLEDAGRILEQVQKGEKPPPGETESRREEPRVPAENLRLVEGLADTLKAWLPVAALGF